MSHPKIKSNQIKSGQINSHRIKFYKRFEHQSDSMILVVDLSELQTYGQNLNKQENEN
jgi:hypothetical protein